MGDRFQQGKLGWWGSQIIYVITKPFLLQKLRGVVSDYCAFHVLVQPKFWQYYFYFLLDQAQTHLDHFNVLDEFWSQISFKSDNGLRISQ